MAELRPFRLHLTNGAEVSSEEIFGDLARIAAKYPEGPSSLWCSLESDDDSEGFHAIIWKPWAEPGPPAVWVSRDKPSTPGDPSPRKAHILAEFEKWAAGGFR
jgi:hypothetical protein